MKFATLSRSVGLSLTALLATPLARAHPGHDGGHDLTWDFTGALQHILTSPYHLVPLVVIAALATLLVRSRRMARKAVPAGSVRK